MKEKGGDLSYLDSKFQNNSAILNLLRSDLKIIRDKSLINHCDSNLKIIFCQKGAICVYCRTWFKIISSLTDHQKKCCRS